MVSAATKIAMPTIPLGIAGFLGLMRVEVLEVIRQGFEVLRRLRSTNGIHWNRILFFMLFFIPSSTNRARETVN